jgi:hypothetical protein
MEKMLSTLQPGAPLHYRCTDGGLPDGETHKSPRPGQEHGPVTTIVTAEKGLLHPAFSPKTVAQGSLQTWTSFPLTQEGCKLLNAGLSVLLTVE